MSPFGALHAKQLINHGHIKVNGNKVKSVARKISALDDQIEYRVPYPSPGSDKSAKSTMLLRRFKDKSELDLMAPPKGPSAVVDYVRALKVKRFTEIFYMTYRNLH